MHEKEKRELQKTIHNLNKEKINYLQEFTLVHDQKSLLQHENEKMRTQIKNYQQTLFEYQKELAEFQEIQNSLKTNASLNNLEQRPEKIVSENFEENVNLNDKIKLIKAKYNVN